MRKILCLVIISLFCLSSFLPVVNSIYFEKGTNNFEFDKISYQEYSRISKNDNVVISIDTYSKVLVGSQDSLLLPKIIHGTAIKEDGQNADNALVRVSASGYLDKTTIVSGGAWQVDIGPDTGIEWLDGTSFNVTIIIDNLWLGFKESIVQGHPTNAGEVVLYATTLVAEADFEEDCYIYGDKVQFYGNAYGGEPPYSWSWDFSDGTTSSSQNPIHRYNFDGIYNACLTVTDNSDKMNTSCVFIKINYSINANASGPYHGDICYCIHLFGIYSGGCPPYLYSWDFDVSDGIQIDSKEKNPYHYYDTPGMYIASFTVSDGNGDSHTDKTSIIISSECDNIFPWPMKSQNKRHTGLSPYSTADNNGMVKWKFKTDNWIEDGPVIGLNGTIYFGSGFNNIPWSLIALNSDGTLKWRYKIGGLIFSAPAIAEDGTIYVGTYDDRMYAINPDGTLKWKFDAGGSISSSPAIAKDGTIYFGTMRGLDKGDIYAINPNSTEKWHYETGYYIVSDPAIGDDGTIYIGSGDSYFYALYPNGTLRWRFKTGDWIKAHPSIANDGTIYISSFDHYLYALHPNGTLKWKYSGGGDEASPSIDEDGIIYVGNEYLHAIYPNGTRKWRIDVGPNIDHSSPAISSDGTIYVGAGKYIIAINSDGSERWRKKIATLWVVSSPSIDIDGTVYIGTSSEETNAESYGYLYAFGIPDKPLVPTIIGPTEGKIGEKQYYTVNTTDYQGDEVEYYIDWDDKTNTGWIGFYPSGENITVNHTWNNRGTYDIRVKARDIHGHESDWTSLDVTMPKNKMIYQFNSLFERLLCYLSFISKGSK